MSSVQVSIVLSFTNFRPPPFLVPSSLPSSPKFFFSLFFISQPSPSFFFYIRLSTPGLSFLTLPYHPFPSIVTSPNLYSLPFLFLSHLLHSLPLLWFVLNTSPLHYLPSQQLSPLHPSMFSSSSRTTHYFQLFLPPLPVLFHLNAPRLALPFPRLSNAVISTHLVF